MSGVEIENRERKADANPSRDSVQLLNIKGPHGFDELYRSGGLVAAGSQLHRFDPCLIFHHSSFEYSADTMQEPDGKVKANQSAEMRIVMQVWQFTSRNSQGSFIYPTTLRG